MMSRNFWTSILVRKYCHTVESFGRSSELEAIVRIYYLGGSKIILKYAGKDATSVFSCFSAI